MVLCAIFRWREMRNLEESTRTERQGILNSDNRHHGWRVDHLEERIRISTAMCGMQNQKQQQTSEYRLCTLAACWENCVLMRVIGLVAKKTGT
mmetsp:Transcript_9600/g.35587  ORF Transcript_9600/g.35587 Transcript_9600/m.35587 type:complete len:93 (+) Transcript_9600:2159-2437(+)